MKKRKPFSADIYMPSKQRQRRITQLTNKTMPEVVYNFRFCEHKRTLSDGIKNQ